jgi:hypothetical protein
VNALLERLGLGRLDAAAVTAFGGRNDNWAGPTTTGEQVFVKTVTPLPDGGCPELERALSFEESAARWLPGGSPLRSPELLGADPAAGVTVHRLVPGARSGAELALDGDFDDALCRAAGRAVGTLHTLPAGDGLDTGEAPLPPLAWLRALPWSAVQERSMAQIAAWQLVQDDAEVVDALARLREGEASVPHAPTHCDLRFDQFIGADEGRGPLYLRSSGWPTRHGMWGRSRGSGCSTRRTPCSRRPGTPGTPGTTVGAPGPGSASRTRRSSGGAR